MSEILEAMLMDAEKSIEAAEVLLGKAFADIAISRAYYAMFYAAQALLESRGLGFSKHSAVISKFGELFAKTGLLPSQLHRYLLDAFRDRQIADYEHGEKHAALAPEVHIAHAKEFVQTARQYLQEHNT